MSATHEEPASVAGVEVSVFDALRRTEHKLGLMLVEINEKLDRLLAAQPVGGVALSSGGPISDADVAVLKRFGLNIVP